MCLPSWDFTCFIVVWFMSLLHLRMGQRSKHEPPLRRSVKRIHPGLSILRRFLHRGFKPVQIPPSMLLLELLNIGPGY